MIVKVTNTHEIPGKFGLYPNGKRESPELNLFPVDHSSMERKFYFNDLKGAKAAEIMNRLSPRFRDQHSCFGKNSIFYISSFQIEQRIFSSGHVGDQGTGPGSGPW